MSDGPLLAQVADLDEPWNYVVAAILLTPIWFVLAWLVRFVVRRKFSLKELLAFVTFACVATWLTVWVWTH
jgi:hypothetical protein